MQGARHQLDLGRVGLTLRKVLKQGVQRAGMPEFVLGHRSGSNGSF